MYAAPQKKVMLAIRQLQQCKHVTFYTAGIEQMAGIEHMVAALLAAQILYKITTPATAGATNPVAIRFYFCVKALCS
jgi:hypothetical protein